MKEINGLVDDLKKRSDPRSRLHVAVYYKFLKNELRFNEINQSIITESLNINSSWTRIDASIAAHNMGQLSLYEACIQQIKEHLNLRRVSASERRLAKEWIQSLEAFRESEAGFLLLHLRSPSN